MDVASQEFTMATGATLYIYRCNAFFSLWSSYEAKLPTAYYTSQLLATGDLLYRKGLYKLASTHCYGRYLASARVKGSDDLVEHLKGKSVDLITATVSQIMHYQQECIMEEGNYVLLLLSN